MGDTACSLINFETVIGEKVTRWGAKGPWASPPVAVFAHLRGNGGGVLGLARLGAGGLFGLLVWNFM